MVNLSKEKVFYVDEGELVTANDLLKLTNETTAGRLAGLVHKAIRVIPNFPEKDIMFRDFTTVWKEFESFSGSISAMQLLVQNDVGKFNKIAGIEARGWVYAVALADRLGKPFIAIRKHGKLPASTMAVKYGTEYSEDAMEIHTDAISKGDKVLLVDDLIATGGSTRAAAKCIEVLGGEVAEIIALADLEGCGGKQYLRSCRYVVKTVLSYPGK